MRVLLTGGTGFVGSHIARALLEAGHEVTVLVRAPAKVGRVFGPALACRLTVTPGDMTDPEAVARALHHQQAVVHAAAVVALERKLAARVLRENFRGVEVVIGGAVEAGIERVLSVSSTVALFRPGAPITANSPTAEKGGAYTRSKAASETYVRSLQQKGARIRTTYPSAVLGPDDPGLSEANRGILAFFRDAALVTEGGLQMVDVRDVAVAHVRLLEAAPASGRHLIGGHFVPWARLVDQFEEMTGTKLRRLAIPGAVMRIVGRIADVVRRVWDFPLPLTYEAMRFTTQSVPIAAPGGDELRLEFRDVRETLRDTLLWLHAAGHLRGDAIGKLKDWRPPA